MDKYIKSITFDFINDEVVIDSVGEVSDLENYLDEKSQLELGGIMKLIDKTLKPERQLVKVRMHPNPKKKSSSNKSKYDLLLAKIESLEIQLKFQTERANRAEKRAELAEQKVLELSKRIVELETWIDEHMKKYHPNGLDEN